MHKRLHALLVVVITASCAPSGPGSSRAGPQAGAAQGDLVSGVDTVFRPLRAGAPRYEPNGREVQPDSALMRALLATVAEQAGATGRPVPRGDSRLYEVARDLARIVPRNSTLPYSPVEFALTHRGIVEPTPSMVVVWASSGATDRVVAHVAQRIRAILETAPYARIGIGSVEREPGVNATVILMLKSFVEVDAMPRAMAASARVKLRAQILPPFTNTHLIVTRADGVVKRTPLPSKKGRVRADVACEGTTGKMQVELLAEDQNGPSVLANFPVWCGTQPPREIVVKTPAVGSVMANADAAERALIGLINDERRRLGLGALSRHDEVTEVARRHSEEMESTGNVAHTMASTGTAADRIKAAGIRTSLVQENLARAGQVEEAHRGLMNSPSHRANIVSPDVTHIGVGIVFGPGEVGMREMYVTELFIRVPPPIRPGAARKEVARLLQGRLRRDAALDPVAQRQAEDLARGVAREVLAQRTRAALEASSFERVRTLISAVADLRSYEAATALSDRRMTHFGVGIAQGPHPELGDNTIYVVVMLGQAGRS